MSSYKVSPTTLEELKTGEAFYEPIEHMNKNQNQYLLYFKRKDYYQLYYKKWFFFMIKLIYWTKSESIFLMKQSMKWKKFHKSILSLSITLDYFVYDFLPAAEMIQGGNIMELSTTESRVEKVMSREQ